MIGTKAMKELSLLKRELKCWENMFERTHGRKPNKDDISVGPAEIRESYRKYRELKESVSQTSKEENKQGEDDVFGKNLNKKKVEEKKSSLPFRKKDWADITPVRLCHGQRPKKKDSPKEIAIDGNVNKNNILDASSEGDKKDQALSISTNIPEVKVTDTSERKVISPAQMNISSRILFPGHHSRNTSVKKKEAISSVWLEKCRPELPENSLCNDVSHSDNLVKNESSSSKFSHTEHNCTIKEINDEDYASSVTMPSESSCSAAKEMEDDQANLNNSSITGTEKRNGTRKSTKINPVAITERSSKEEIFKSEGEGPSNSRQTEAKKNFDSECFSDGHSKNATNSQQLADTRGSNVTNLFRIANPTVSNTSVGDSDCSSLDPSQEIMSLKRKAEERTTELEKPSKRVRREDDNEEETFEESKVDNSADEVESEEDLSKATSRKHSTSQRTHAKVSSGLVSDNFQRLNMKHRSYRRRGGGISGAAHKRRAWKQIMKSRGEFVPQKSWSSKGRGSRAGEKSGACFKCGEEGHWAKNCQGRRKQTSSLNHCEKVTEDVEMEEFEPLPTIEEAAMMAAGIQPDGDSPGSDGLVILPHHLPRPVYTPPSPPPSVDPLYQPVDGKPVEPTKEVLSALGKLGFSSFRPGQQEAVMRILCGLSSLVVLSTGAGKSLCYQLPAFLYAKRSPCLTVVISPLVSLMEDQITGLPHGLKGACLHTNLTKAQRQKVVDDLCSGKVSVLLLSPEALVGGGSGNGRLPAVSRLPQIAFACIDEAHCVSEWSHNFRPSYLRVCKVLREKFGVRCFLGLTATATLSTAASVAEHLGIVHDPGAVIRGGAVPPNLFLSVSCDSDKTQALLQLLQGRRFSQCDSIIIYCTRREQTEKLASTLRTCLQSTRLPSGWDEQSETGEEENIGKKNNTKGKGKKKSSKPVAPKWDAECYHAGLSAAQRRRVQKRFMTGQLRVVVATVAFGMGLDKPDVRAIIHYNLPRSFETYVQEIGRAGRDGLPSHCHVFLDPEGKDMCELRRHVYANTVDRSTIKKLVRRAFPRCECKKLHQQQQERNAGRYNEDELLDIEGACGDMMDSNLEAELQAVELQYQKAVEDDACKIGEENEHERVKERSDSVIEATQSEQSCSSKSEETLCPGLESKAIEGGKGVESEINEGVLCHQNSTQEPVQRLCGGHEVAMVIECLIQELDMREENIATLLCYLELHARRWLEVLQPVKSTCEVKFYGGHAQLRAVAQNVPSIAAAVSHTTTTPASFKRSNSISFSVVELADKMGWDLEPVCREIRALQWNTCLSRDYNLADMGLSGILVEFSDLSFHLRSPGDLSDEERDGVCDFLEDRILAEERSQLQQLQFVYDSLKSVSFSEFWQCADDVDEESDKQLKQVVRSYFEDSSDKTKKELRELAKARKGSKNICSSITRDDHVNWDIISRDIRSLVGVHHDHSFTGRVVARIFHGIDSPCYPAEVWGRDRRFWRKHLDVEFNSLRKFATQELIKFR